LSRRNDWLVGEILDEISHFKLGDDTISIDINIREELVKLTQSGWLLPSVGKKLVQKSKGLSFLKVSVSVIIIFVEDIHDLDLDVLINFNWNVEVVLHEKGAFFS
jgi:hypothetical protein